MAAEKRRRRGRGRGRGGNRKRNRGKQIDVKMPDPIPERDYEPCPICDKPIQHVFSAIAHGGSGRPAHIECVVAELTERETLAPGERIVYLGRGNFGVVSKEPKVEEGKKLFNVVRRIQYEEGQDEAPEWRRELSPGISRDYKPQPKSLEEAGAEPQSLAESLGTDRDAIYMPRLN